jgi:hypothetical protein
MSRLGTVSGTARSLVRGCRTVGLKSGRIADILPPMRHRSPNIEFATSVIRRLRFCISRVSH